MNKDNSQLNLIVNKSELALVRIMQRADSTNSKIFKKERPSNSKNESIKIVILQSMQ